MAPILPNRDSADSAIVLARSQEDAAIEQFIQDVVLIDLPPGTSDEPLSVIQQILDST